MGHKKDSVFDNILYVFVAGAVGPIFWRSVSEIMVLILLCLCRPVPETSSCCLIIIRYLVSHRHYRPSNTKEISQGSTKVQWKPLSFWHRASGILLYLEMKEKHTTSKQCRTLCLSFTCKDLLSYQRMCCKTSWLRWTKHSKERIRF